MADAKGDILCNSVYRKCRDGQSQTPLLDARWVVVSGRWAMTGRSAREPPEVLGML